MREEKYDISGMHCAACSASVERVTRKLPGVERSEVNLTTGIMTIAYDESQMHPGADRGQGGEGRLRRRPAPGAPGPRHGPE